MLWLQWLFLGSVASSAAYAPGDPMPHFRVTTTGGVLDSAAGPLPLVIAVQDRRDPFSIFQMYPPHPIPIDNNHGTTVSSIPSPPLGPLQSAGGFPLQTITVADFHSCHPCARAETG